MRSRPPSRSPARVRSAFTLMEVLVVVVILGILAAILLIGLGAGVQDSERQAFISSLRTFVEAAELYHVKEGEHVADGSTGVVPAGFEDYIDEMRYEMITPIGGRWDTEYNESGVTSALGVHFNGDGVTRDDAYMTEVDALFDDGDLASGAFRRLAATRYYYVLVD